MRDNKFDKPERTTPKPAKQDTGYRRIDFPSLVKAGAVNNNLFQAAPAASKRSTGFISPGLKPSER